MDPEEMRLVFRGLEYRLIFTPHESRHSSATCEVRDGDGWQELAGFSLREAEHKFLTVFNVAVTHAYEQGKE